MDGPRYIVWVSMRQYYFCDSLVKAFEMKAQTGGIVYEPLGLSAAEKVAKEPLHPLHGHGLGEAGA